MSGGAAKLPSHQSCRSSGSFAGGGRTSSPSSTNSTYRKQRCWQWDHSDAAETKLQRVVFGSYRTFWSLPGRIALQWHFTVNVFSCIFLIGNIGNASYLQNSDHTICFAHGKRKIIILYCLEGSRTHDRCMYLGQVQRSWAGQASSLMHFVPQLQN